MGVAGGPDMIENGLVLSLDASDRNSYISGSTTWYDLSGLNKSGSLTNGPTFNTGSLGSIVFDGTYDYFVGSTGSYASVGSGPFTHDIWFYQPTVLRFSGSFNGKFGVLFSGNAMQSLECFLIDNITGSGVPTTIGMSSYGGGTIGSISNIVTYSFPIQTWHNVTITRDVTGSILVYKNTSVIATGSITNNFTNTPSIVTGKRISYYIRY